MSGSRDKTIRIWDSSSGECVKVLSGHTNVSGLYRRRRRRRRHRRRRRRRRLCLCVCVFIYVVVCRNLIRPCASSALYLYFMLHT